MIQVEDTKIVEMESDTEKVIDILVEPSVDLDIRYTDTYLNDKKLISSHS